MDEIEETVAEHRRQLIEFVRRRLPQSDRDLGSDFVQDTLLEAQERAGLVRALTPKQTLAWLVTVLKFKLTNANRTRHRRDRLSSMRMDAAPSEGSVDRSPTPPALAEQKEQMRRIETALAQLTDGQRQAIVLRFYAGFTLKEIGRQTGSTRASVHQLIQRGLSHLAKTGLFTIADLA